jgi:hypothetical protein
MALQEQQHRAGTFGVGEDQATRVMFRVSGLYAITRESIPISVSPTETIDSGPTILTLDPEADASANVGVVDFEQNTMRMRNGLQLVFTGLHKLVVSGEYDRALLNPPRGVSISKAKINPDYAGWDSETCIDFLPGSLWSSTGGG